MLVDQSVFPSGDTPRPCVGARCKPSVCARSPGTGGCSTRATSLRKLKSTTATVKKIKASLETKSKKKVYKKDKISDSDDESLKDAKVVIASHQGRVGNNEYTGMHKHAEVLEKLMGRKIKYVEDTIGESAQNAIKNLEKGEILLLDNLRLCAEENYEFTPENAAKTIMVSRLSKLFDLCVLDSFPSAHRSHPSIVGFAQVLPSCAGRIVEREVRNLDEMMTVAKAPHVIILGGSKVPDRLEAIKLLIQNGRADHVLLTGLIGNVIMRAQSMNQITFRN